MSEYEYWRDLSELAHIQMARLGDKGLTDLGPIFGDETQEAGEHLRDQTVPPDIRPVQLDKNQIIWVRPWSSGLNSHGYQPVEVSEEPPRSDTAIIAALTALVPTTVDPPEAVRTIIPFVERWKEEEARRENLDNARYKEKVSETLDEIMREPRFRGKEHMVLRGLDPRMPGYLEYVNDLLRHYRLGFDDLPYQERIALAEHTTRYINKFLEALRLLVQFIEHGTPKGGIAPAFKDVARDVMAAELRDVTGWSFKKIAEVIGEPPPKKWTSKDEHSKVRKMCKRGKKVLEKAFGKEGWKAKVASKKEERERWLSLSEGKRWLERMSVIGTRFGMSPEEARAFVARSVDEKSQEQGVTREVAALRWEEGSKPKGLDELGTLIRKKGRGLT